MFLKTLQFHSKRPVPNFLFLIKMQAHLLKRAFDTSVSYKFLKIFQSNCFYTPPVTAS